MQGNGFLINIEGFVSVVLKPIAISFYNVGKQSRHKKHNDISNFK